ncbi:LacI family DNA-binding transcriptional regulator [Ruminococcus sp. OA3]|uniref:LacI family DNA-binding transcriptional regulator n=1 Tax=Ruminococcus sp. OA3 TaxID=2914164 RepID=UPI001F05C186|nr:LacI family DNA-binding transcriptional regulator [Ruminococcus sp. OA3]MCH1984013.1 LacI family DNA-binding transcriptional regulator [Ruminococcus sp. OA3]
MKVTLEQVAKYAGVSRGTVDRVVNRRGNVKPEVEQRVREALQALGYERNKIASALAYSKNEKKVCAMFQKTDSEDYNAKIMQGIHDAKKELKDFGITVEVAICNSSDAGEFIRKIDVMIQEEICGFAIKAPSFPEISEKIDWLVQQGMPVITFNSDIPESHRTCFVGQNLYQSGRVAGNIMASLIRPGEKIVIGCGIPQYNAHQERVDGFVYELKKRGFQEEQWKVFHTDQNYEVTYRCLEEIFKEEENIRGIYMSVEPNEACGAFLEEHSSLQPPYVVCHDTAPETIEYLKKGVFDYIIDQDVYMQSYYSLLLLRDAFRYGTCDPGKILDVNIYNAACFE